MSPSFAEIAPHYDALRPLSAGDRARLQTMMREAALSASDVVLDVGSGTGRITFPLASLTTARVVGIDAEERMLDVARSKDTERRVEWLRGSVYRLPLAEKTVALAVMVMVAHLLKRRVSAFREIARVLRPGGMLSVWTFTPGHVDRFYLNEYFPSIATIDRARFAPVASLEDELRRAGFSSVRADIQAEERQLSMADVVDRVRGRYISTLSMLPPLEYRLGLQRLEERLAEDRSLTLEQRSEWALLTARTS